MNKNTNLDLKRLITFFQKEESISFAILFGSYAQEKERLNSDVDIAVHLNLADKLQRAQKRNILIAKLLHILKKDIDLIILNDAQDNFLLNDIFTEGKLLFCRDTEQYFDFKTKRLTLNRK